MTRPLEGITVVEAANYVSGPYAGMQLADLGADVVKVEPPTGDPYRRFGGARLSAHWVSTNRGKRNVVADLKTPQGVQTLLDLVDGADVFLSNWRPDVADRLGVGDDVLVSRNPRLIRCWVSGWGPTGPSSDLPAFDVVMQGRGAMIDAASRDGVLEVLPGYPVDKATAMFAVQSILAALFARERGAGGERIDVAMLDATAYFDFPDLFTSRVFVDAEPPDAHSLTATAVRAVPASDGAIVIAAVTGSQIKGACRAVGHEEWIEEVFSSTSGGMGRMFDLFASVTPGETVAHWLERFAAEDVPAAPCLGIDDHLADPQVRHNQLYTVADVPGVGRVRTVRYPAVGASWGKLPTGVPPVHLEEAP